MYEEETKTYDFKISFSISRRSIWSLIGFLILGSFTFINFKWWIIPSLAPSLEKNYVWDIKRDFGLIWPPVIGYILIAGTICLLINIFKRLKRWDEKGLIMGLILCFIGGLITGLFFSIYLASFAGFINGLIMGLIMGLIIGLIVGLPQEFK